MTLGVADEFVASFELEFVEDVADVVFDGAGGDVEGVADLAVGATLGDVGEDFSFSVGGFAIGGIGTATLAALILYQLLGIGRRA